MDEANVHQTVPRGLVALCLACATAIPLGAMTTPTAATPSHRVLLSTTGEMSEVASAVTAAGGTVVQTFEIAQTLLADLPENVTAPEGSFVVPNVTMKFNAAPAATATSDAANTFRETIKAPGGQSGSGVTVAVVDTGVDDSVAVDVAKHVNVSGDTSGDGLGHGTFMAGLVAGDDNEFGGVAPGAEVLDVQVAAQDGSTDLARVLAGLQAVADERASNPSLDVAMLALSTESPLPPWMDPLTRGLDRLWGRGVTVVVASGNDGKNGVSSPATDPVLLVAGAQDEADTAARADDTVPDFSSYGKVFGQRRPDVVAPGVSLISTAAPQSAAYLENPASHVGEGFLKGTGTSMSAAVTAGAIATLLAERPGLTPDQAKRLVVDTAYTTSDLKLKTGAGNGGLDLQAALEAPVPPATDESTGGDSEYGPSEADAAAWSRFAQAWADGNLRALAKAWVELSEQSRRWAATAWSLAALAQGLQGDEATFESRRWAGHHWATSAWESRRWATDEWVSRRWADEEWLAEMWDSRRWASRRWAANDWLAFAWTLRTAETDPAVMDMWREDVWDSRRWASRRWADEDWSSRRWASRRWADEDWSSRRWADTAWVSRRWAEEAWDSRRWADYSWESRRWAAGDWSSRRWADYSWDSRRWATDTWDSRRWATLGW